MADVRAIGHFVGGKHRTGTSGRTGPVFDPATGQQTGAVDLASAEEVDEAVAAAKEAFPDWRATAVGRRAELADLGLDTVGLDPEGHAIKVDEHMRAGDGIWAVGDVTGHGGFTHMAMYQAAIATRDILGEAGPPADYRAVPRVTFTDPEIGVVGMTESEARAKGIVVGPDRDLI